MKYFVTVNGKDHEVELTERLGQLEISVDGASMDLSVADVDGLGQFAVVVDRRAYGVSIEGDTHDGAVCIAGSRYAFEIEDERERAANAAARARGGKGGVVKAVMPGVVVTLLVEVGAEVEEDQPMLILEAMKMQNEIKSPIAGTVEAIFVEAGQAVEGGAKLVSIKAPAEEA
ncbi:biotin/lipoyl-containing protein [Engelhardtia mirabilis]|uniref:2-oxoglutarate carboxylase large subunit n=1 Tax=Engelhardtia mirabilis TaxID=2528011 RepID=A0A518BPS0_9BACT|nr:2-oxoglutarate carboxylase large subunit [Planctomycetes bacterium Pla133]QDV03305.1 2-oxoglutarate carboxylase large subunit [Planctomycetes bacterium Pla86]